MTNANVNIGIASEATTAQAAQTAGTVQIIHDQNARQYQKLYKFEGYFQYGEQDAGNNNFVWVTPLIRPDVQHIDAATGEPITEPSTIPVYMRAGMTKEQFEAEKGAGIHTFYVLAGNIPARNELVLDREVQSYANVWYNGNLESVEHLPLRQKPPSERAHLSQEQLKRESATDRFLARGAYGRAGRMMGMNNEQVMAAGMQQHVNNQGLLARGKKLIGDFFSV